MIKYSHVKRACAGALVLGTASIGMFLHPIVSAAEVQPPRALPQHVTPWKRVPAPHLGAVPARPRRAPLSSTSWTDIGPAPLAPGKLSGRITGIAAHPTQAGAILVTAAGGGVWMTADGGTNWTPLTDPQKTLSMGAIAVGSIPAPGIIYAGTGEANNTADSNFGRGILISTNGGATWSLSTGPSNAFDRLTTSQIAVDQTNASVAYAAMANLGTNGLCCANTGIWKTTNGGTTWTNTTTSIVSTTPWSAVVIDPNNSQTLYAAVGKFVGRSFNGVYKSTNGGGTWSLLSNGPPIGPSGLASGRIAIAVSKANSQIVYVTASGTGQTGSTTFGTLYKIMRSNDGGSTFTDLTSGTPNYMGTQGYYDTYVIADPSNAAVVYVGGQDSILRSIDSGVTWSDISLGGSSPHVDHHAAAFDANGKLLDGDDGGIYRLDNPTSPSWTNLNGNLETIQFQGIGLHPTNPNIAIGGSQDNGTEIFTGSRVWTQTDGGDGGFAKFSQTNPLVAYHQIPYFSGGSRFFRVSIDGGMTWTPKTAGIVADQTKQNGYAPFVVDPFYGDRVLYGTVNVWETTDKGTSWTNLSAGKPGWNPSGRNVAAIGLARTTATSTFAALTIYAAIDGFPATIGQIFVTTDHGANWAERSIAGTPHVQDLQVDPGNSLCAYAVINKFNTGGTVFRTTNGGTSWTNISGNLPNEPVWSLQIGTSSGTLYIGADDGVYVTANFGATWARLGTGLPNAQVFQLELNSNLHILGAATHGRGMWEIATP